MLLLNNNKLKVLHHQGGHTGLEPKNTFYVPYSTISKRPKNKKAL
jgi:hypothetical protein